MSPRSHTHIHPGTSLSSLCIWHYREHSAEMSAYGVRRGCPVLSWDVGKRVTGGLRPGGEVGIFETGKEPRRSPLWLSSNERN